MSEKFLLLMFPHYRLNVYTFFHISLAVVHFDAVSLSINCCCSQTPFILNTALASCLLHDLKLWEIPIFLFESRPFQFSHNYYIYLKWAIFLHNTHTLCTFIFSSFHLTILVTIFASECLKHIWLFHWFVVHFVTISYIIFENECNAKYVLCLRH